MKGEYFVDWYHINHVSLIYISFIHTYWNHWIDSSIQMKHQLIKSSFQTVWYSLFCNEINNDLFVLIQQLWHQYQLFYAENAALIYWFFCQIWHHTLLPIPFILNWCISFSSNSTFDWIAIICQLKCDRYWKVLPKLFYIHLSANAFGNRIDIYFNHVQHLHNVILILKKMK